MPSAEQWLLGPAARLTVRPGSLFSSALRAFLPPDLCVPEPGAAESDIHDVTEHGAGFHLTRGSLRICPVARQVDLAPSLEKLVSARACAFTPGAAVLHAALLRENGRTWLLPAERRAGKSTFCLQRARHGAEYGGDDLVFLDHASQSLIPFPKAVTLKEGSFALAPDHLDTHHDPVRGPIRYWFPPRTLRDPVPVGALNAILMPRYLPEAGASIQPVPAPLAALALVQQLFGGLDRDPRHLGWVERLARVPAFSLTYPDTATMHRLMDELEVQP